MTIFMFTFFYLVGRWKIIGLTYTSANFFYYFLFAIFHFHTSPSPAQDLQEAMQSGNPVNVLSLNAGKCAAGLALVTLRSVPLADAQGESRDTVLLDVRAHGGDELAWTSGAGGGNSINQKMAEGLAGTYHTTFPNG